MGLAFVSIITYHFRRLVHIWLFQLISVGVQRITPISANETRARGLTRKRIHDHNPFHCFPFTCRLPSGWATGNESAEKLRQLNWKCPVHGLSVRKLNYDSSLDGNYRTYENRKKKNLRQFVQTSMSTTWKLVSWPHMRNAKITICSHLCYKNTQHYEISTHYDSSPKISKEHPWNTYPLKNHEIFQEVV